MGRHSKQSGFTLIELLVTIVILTIAITTLMLVVSDSISRSADPMLRSQASSIGHAYLEEIMSKSYTVGPGTGSRPLFDDVLDYNTLPDTVVRDINGVAISGLEQYSVSVNVTDDSVSGQSMRRIQVEVTSPNGDTVTMVGYRGNI